MTVHADLMYLKAGIPLLEDYLLSTELYYPLTGELPRLTLGGILLALARAGSRASKFAMECSRVRAAGQTAWEAKSKRELLARERSWMDYLAEVREDLPAAARLYPHNVRCRAMLSLLDRPEHESDSLLRGIFREGRFVWEPECAVNFPPGPFWYLYGSIKE